MRRLRIVFGLALVEIVPIACSPPAWLRPIAEPPVPAAVETRALLLLLVDTQRFEPVVLAGAMRGGPELREAAAEAMGRIGDPRSRSYLAELLADPEPAVRRAAAFALGELDYPEPPAAAGAEADPPRPRAPDDRVEAARALLVAAVDPDRETGTLAVEALGKIGVSVVDVLSALTAAELAETERWARLLPPLFRFDEEVTVAAAAGGLAAAGDESELRRAAVYALSRNPRPAALPALRELALDPDPRIRGWAARALGIVGEPAADLPLLAGLLDDEDRAPTVQALRAGGVLRAAATGAGGDRAASLVDPALAERWRRRLAELLADPRPHVRLAALEAAAPWLPDTRLEAPLAARAGGEGVAAPPETFGTATSAPEGPTPAGTERRGSGDEGAARTPAEVPPADRAPLAAVAERAAALVALAQGLARAPDIDDVRPESAAATGAPGIVELVEAAAAAEEPLLRAAAARAAEAIGPPGRPALARLLADPAGAVRAAAYAAALGDAPDAPVPLPAPAAGPAAPTAAGAAAGSRSTRRSEFASPSPSAAPPGSAPPSHTAADLAAASLAADSDPGVEAVVLGWLADHPVVGYEELTKATRRLLRDGGDAETALAAVRAIGARGSTVARERGGAVTVLERLAASGDWLIRRAAARELAGLGRPAPAVEPPQGRPVAVYREIVERTREPRTAEVVTSAGTFRVELACPEAPRTCLSFLHLAGQGFYDGLTFHRVVPDFVVQGGDPRGDGFGGPPFTLRDEINRLRYERGTVGMALAGPDTGGSQFFVALAPQPHLDGGYTAFGRVVAGGEVLDRIVPGTVIERVRETGGGP